MKKLILLVEDDEDLRKCIKEAILDEGTYEVIDLENGIKALEWLGLNPKPSIIITDHMMLGKGADLARAANRLSLNTIIITGNHDSALAALRSYNLRVPVIKKPFDIFKLLSMVDKYTAEEFKDQSIQASA